MRPRAARRGLDVTIVALLAACVVACSANGASSALPSGKLAVVTTSAVFGDFIANVGGDLVTVTSLVPSMPTCTPSRPRPPTSGRSLAPG